MYQFTTTTVINSNLDSNGVTPKFAGSASGFNVTRVNFFKKDNVESVYKNAYTAGVKEVRAWTINIGDTAPKAAGVIHSDFEKGFIRAEVIAYDDYVQYGSESKVKEAGKLRVEGKEYIVKDGDVMHFRFNV